MTRTITTTSTAMNRPLPPQRFVPKAVIAEAARRAQPLDYAKFRADLDAVVDPSTEG